MCLFCFNRYHQIPQAISDTRDYAFYPNPPDIHKNGYEGVPHKHLTFMTLTTPCQMCDKHFSPELGTHWNPWDQIEKNFPEIVHILMYASTEFLGYLKLTNSTDFTYWAFGQQIFV